ncbi:MAG: BMP family ABC transporter substrate-binding protein [Caldilineaceae bacterium]
MYLAGIAAGGTTQSMNRFHHRLSDSQYPGFCQCVSFGCALQNPDVNTHLVIDESWVDLAKEAAAVNALSGIGVDVVTMIVDSPTTVVQTAEALGMYSIGFHSGALQELAPNGWLTGVAYTWGNYYTQVVQQIRSGQWQSSHVRGGIESDMLQIAPFGPAVSEETRNRIIAARTDIIRGQLQIFQGPIIDNEGLERIPAGRAGGLELLDTTDWLVAGTTQLDVSSVAVAPIPVLPTPTPAATAGAEATSTTAPPTATAVPASASTADLILAATEDHDECTFFTEATAQILRDQFSLSVDVVNLIDDAEMYSELANRQQQRTVDVTVCFGDPKDRPFLREHFGFLKHIGDVYWQNDELRLQVLANAGFSAELERNEVCIYRFFKNMQFDITDVATQVPAQWIADNTATISSWASCELLP